MIRADACDPALARDVRRRLVLQNEADWQDIPVIVITSLDRDAKDRERLNAGVQFVLVKEKFRPADLVERIRRLVHSKPPVLSGMEAAS